MIKLSLIHPTQAAPIQSWTFDNEPVVRIGRSKDNDVVIHGSLVSRHHLELWNRQTHWEIINFGTNGTFVNGKPVRQMPVWDGMTFRLGSTGPKLHLHLNSSSLQREEGRVNSEQ
ncbi:FHA domain-containing protein [Baaleninema sp.]|uniref:FHA domain-containing protein n=1 Tax=Baaleninema sp. TaxID=3101197 RepID=UPI003CFCF040